MELDCTLPSAAEPDLAEADWAVPHVIACHSFLQARTAISLGERPRRTVELMVMALFGPNGSNWRCPFRRAKRTSQLRTQTSEFDPTRT